MDRMYDKEKITKLHFDRMEKFEKLKHKHIMKEIEAIKEAKLLFYNREAIRISKGTSAREIKK